MPSRGGVVCGEECDDCGAPGWSTMGPDVDQAAVQGRAGQHRPQHTGRVPDRPAPLPLGSAPQSTDRTSVDSSFVAVTKSSFLRTVFSKRYVVDVRPQARSPSVVTTWPPART